jgi:hypothetical protein
VEKSGRKKYITGMEEAPEIGKESSLSANANGIIVPFLPCLKLFWK